LRRAPARAAWLLLLAALTPGAGAARADQLQPYQFDVNLAEKPAEVQSRIDEYSQGLPGLPLPRMTTTELAGPMTLWLYHEATRFLDRLVLTDQQDYAWPRDLGSCSAHVDLTLQPLLIDGAPAGCAEASDRLAAAVAERDACGAAAEPERYVLAYPPGVVNAGNTNTVLDLIGVMGSTFAELPPLYDGVLPGDFVPRLRDLLRKLRHDELLPPLEAQLAAFTLALSLLEEHDDCFVPDARATLAGRLDGLVLEATAQRDHLLALRREGEAEHAREQLRLATLSRERNALPEPSLTQADREFLAFWIGAVYWRLRGGGIVLLGGTQDARRLGLRRPFTVIGELTGGADGTEAADGLYCEIFSGWGEWFDMGTTPGQDDKYHDLVEMTHRGHDQILTATSGTSLLNACTIPDAPFVLNLAGLQGKGYDPTELYAGGLSMGPCYYFPWDQLRGWVWAQDVQPPYAQVVDGPTAIGELCAGGSIALGMARTLLHGRALAQAPFLGKDAVFLVEPTGEATMACAAGGVYARVTVIPLDASGAPLPPGQAVSVVEDPPRVIGGSVEAFTDPTTGVTEYRLEVGSDRCTKGSPHTVRIRVNGVVLTEAPQVHFVCPEVATGGVTFIATPARVPADGRSAAEIRIATRDTCGNPAFGREVALEVLGDAPASLDGSSVLTRDAPGDPLDGVAVVQATSQEVGAMGLRAVIDGQTFQSGPGLVTFTPPDAGPDGGVAPDSGGGDAPPTGDGCSCRASPGRGAALPWILLLLWALRPRVRGRRS
jgi:hypothetical protein